MRKKKLYVAGYDDDNECVYGYYIGNRVPPCSPMTISDAKKEEEYLE